MNLKQILSTGARELGTELTAQQIGLFLEYLDNLKTWNKKINLTGVESDKEIVIKHFLDSVSVVPFISENSKLLDMGSGAGFPGIPLKILIPPLEVTLLDSAEKKVFFMRDVIRKLQLKRVVSMWGRAEDPNNRVSRGCFDIVVSRAVGRIERLVKLAETYISREGKIILMRGKRGLEEWEELKDKPNKKFRLLESKELSLPFGGHKRVILIVGSLK